MAASGYSAGGMKAPRCAHWPVLVPMLALGMAIGPVRAEAAPAKRAPVEGKAPEREPEAPVEETEAPPKDENVPEAGEPPAGAAEGTRKQPGTAKQPKGTPKSKKQTGEPPKGEGAAEPETEAVTPPESEADAASSPAEGGTAPAEGEPTESPPAEPPPTETPPEPALEPEITVEPRPVEPSIETSTVRSGAGLRETVADPRRLRSDERILFRAGILSLGVAAAAVVPTAVGLQQAYVAHEDGDPARERTMRGLGIGAGIAAGTYAITGVVLMSLGARQRRAAVAPAVGPGQLGLALRARF